MQFRYKMTHCIRCKSDARVSSTIRQTGTIAHKIKVW